MSQAGRLVPETVSATARPLGRWPVAFGSRAFILMLVGFAWLGPSWWDARFIVAMVAWDVTLLVVWGWDLARLPRAKAITVRRSWVSPVALATRGRVDLTLIHRGGIGIVAELIDDVSPELCREAPRVVIAAPARLETHASYAFEPTTRGDLPAGSVFLRYRSWLKIAERWAVADLPQQVLVYLNLDASRMLTLYLVRSRQNDREKRLDRQRGLGREFESLREYQKGDQWRDVCWTASARGGKLISKIYQVERDQPIWLLLDAGRLLRARVGGLTKLDHAVNAALGLASVALHSGDRVGLLAYGRRPLQQLPPTRGTSHLRVVAESLARVRPEVSEADHDRAADTLLSVQRRRSLVIWITDLAETATVPEVIESALRVTARHIVVFVAIGQPELNQIVADGPGSSEQMYRYVAALEMVQRRDMLLRRLRHRGAFTIESEPGQLPTAIVNRYLQVKERGLI